MFAAVLVAIIISKRVSVSTITITTTTTTTTISSPSPSIIFIITHILHPIAQNNASNMVRTTGPQVKRDENEGCQQTARRDWTQGVDDLIDSQHTQ